MAIITLPTCVLCVRNSNFSTLKLLILPYSTLMLFLLRAGSTVGLKLGVVSCSVVMVAKN